jgi:hypothetical protein
MVFSLVAEASLSSGMQSLMLSALGKENTTRIKYLEYLCHMKMMKKVGALRSSRTNFLPSFSYYFFYAYLYECRFHVLDEADLYCCTVHY